MNKRLIVTFIAIGLGGAIGTLLRYIINLQMLGMVFPFGTIIENLFGSFLLGLLTGWVIHVKINDVIKLGLGVGVCGGFTTMSTFSADLYSLLMNDQWRFIGFYLVISIIGSVTLALLGYTLGETQAAKFQFTRKRKKVSEVE